jgi:hypothetical protein
MRWVRTTAVGRISCCYCHVHLYDSFLSFFSFFSSSILLLLFNSFVLSFFLLDWFVCYNWKSIIIRKLVEQAWKRCKNCRICKCLVHSPSPLSFFVSFSASFFLCFLLFLHSPFSTNVSIRWNSTILNRLLSRRSKRSQRSKRRKRRRMQTL